MKKLILCCISLFAAASAVRAQDLIVKQNGDEMQAKVIEIGESQIKYRKFSNPEGPVYSISKPEVFFIRYENGTKEVITSETTPSSPATADAGDKYAHVNQAVAKAKAPLHEKSLLWGTRLDFGYAWINSSVDDAPTGLMYGVGAVLDWFPNRYSSSGFGAKIGFSMYDLSGSTTDETLKRSDVNIDLCWSVRGKALGVKLGPHIGIPVSSKVGDLDAMPVSKVSFGLTGEITWSPKHFDLGAGYAYSFTNAYDLEDATSTLMSIYITFGYRF